ncbi:hypothetical protein PV04_07997 [Phialophora macrospora]|uniref:Uncharacterized protein n=1 Tax=Phialophora macrospora TaxID=1851006 RepID=A0A0D2FG35_9EURO|nr:hypothetical protein PV04_07997 [Phialophora macrospora]
MLAARGRVLTALPSIIERATIVKNTWNMESCAGRKNLVLHINSPNTQRVPDLPDFCEAESMSVSQSLCKGRNSNSSETGNLAQLGHDIQRAPIATEKTTGNSKKGSFNDDSYAQRPGHQGAPCPRRRLSTLWAPYLAVLIPNLVLPATLLGFVFGYQIDLGRDIFQLDTDTVTKTQHRGYYLVAFSVTRLAIISSCASTLAPFLTPPILLLWRLHTIKSIEKAPDLETGNAFHNAKPSHLSMLLGLHAGSIDELLKYLYRTCGRSLPKRRSRDRGICTMPRPIHLVAVVSLSCIFITLSMWTADTIFHTLSNSVIIETYDSSPAAVQSFGYGPTRRCQHFDRQANLCLPCTVDLSDEMSLLEMYTRANEVYRLATNVSEISQVQPITSNLSVLLPRVDRICNQTDYRARTIGVSAQCRPITQTCNPRELDVPTYTMFNCSANFRGIIGQSPVRATSQNFTVLDPDTPALDLKPSAYLQFGFYRDAALSEPYNSVGWNVSADGWAVSAGAASTQACPNDEDLPATVHMGVAGRFSASSAKAGVNLAHDDGLATKTLYSDFIFECALAAHEVEYIWASGAVRVHTAKRADAAMLNMYIGQLSYYQQAASDDLSGNILQMALQPTSQSMADTWARLFRVRVLSVIGGNTRSSLNLQQQTRRQVLVARVHVGGMWFLVSCCLGTALFVSWIALRGLWIVSVDPMAHEQAATLSYDGRLRKILSESASETANVDLSSRKRDMPIPTKTNAAAAPAKHQHEHEHEREPECTASERSFTGHSPATTMVSLRDIAIS